MKKIQMPLNEKLLKGSNKKMKKKNKQTFWIRFEYVILFITFAFYYKLYFIYYFKPCKPGIHFKSASNQESN